MRVVDVSASRVRLRRLRTLPRDRSASRHHARRQPRLNLRLDPPHGARARRNPPGERPIGFQLVHEVFDRKDNDITYFYESQLLGETAPVDDIHFHPVETRTVRASIVLKF